MADPPGTHLDAFAYYPRLQKLKQHVEEHISDEISLAAAADIAVLEQKHFSAFFRAET